MGLLTYSEMSFALYVGNMPFRHSCSAFAISSLAVAVAVIVLYVSIEDSAGQAAW